MLNENDNTPSCKNCKYFIQHYVRFKTNFHPLNNGHCGNFRVSFKKRSNITVEYVCERWEQAEIVSTADTMEQIKNSVSAMQKQLEGITSVLTFIKSE